VSAYSKSATSYAECLSANASSITTNALMNLFTPDRKICGIDYNYIVNID